MGRIRNTSKMLQTKGWLNWFENLCWCSVTLETFFVFLLQYFTSGINWKLAKFFPQYFMPGISWKLARFLLLNQSNKKLETPSPWRRLSDFLRCAVLVFLIHVYSMSTTHVYSRVPTLSKRKQTRAEIKYLLARLNHLFTP